MARFAPLVAVAFLIPTPAWAEPIRVVVWDEQQPTQKQAYENFLGNAIADHLGKQPGLTVRSVRMADPNQGIGDDVLDACDVLIWWGHVRQAEIAPEAGRRIVERIKAGKLSLLTLHSAHWSTPFVEAMHERTRMDVERKFPAANGDKVEVEYVVPPRHVAPKKDAPLTPSVYPRKFPDGRVTLRVQLPNCCFPAYRPDAGASVVRTVKPDHPIAKGIPASFPIPQTEMYDEPFHVPEPDEVVFEERWPGGEWFRSGCVWQLGRGKVFYFRPGHETYPIFKQQAPLQIIENAVRWLGGAGKAEASK
jgi:trehalose utilization protein